MDHKMVGCKIAKARKRINLSQAQVSEQLFISPQAVGKWERGESIPDIVTINKLAKILDVDMNYFSENSQSSEDGRASNMTNNGTGQTEQKVQEDGKPSAAREQSFLTNFSGSALSNTDFAGVSAPKGEFSGSDLRGANFSGADLTGSRFMGSDLREANFNGTNLTDCTFYALNLTDASFNGTMLVRTEFSSSELTRVTFTNAKFINAKLTKSDLTKTIFENCNFNGVDFKSSDLTGVSFDGQTFVDVKFDNAALNGASFKKATLKNVSFRPTFALTNKYYKTLTTICFEGAMMDKLTYAALKGVGIDLSKATTI
jgi:uncharacterized protein YjbI with pentapeptide repeats